MRFPVHFTRTVTGGGALLPAQSAPTAAPNTATMPNLLTALQATKNGWPVQRIAVTYKYTGGGGAVNLSADLYMYEDTTQAWYKMNSAGVITLKPGCVTYVDAITLCESAQTNNDVFGNGSSTPGGLECVVVVIDPGGLANGTYDFCIGPDSTVTAA